MANATAAAYYTQVSGLSYQIWEVDEGASTHQEVLLVAAGNVYAGIRLGLQALVKNEALLALLRPDRRESFLAYANSDAGRAMA